jgi:precorrin-2/cobalt-factor-2 C20-methyltransferase
MKYGILYGVSVGPGDPELMTVKAVRILERCPVVAAPRTAGEKTLALDIASGAADLTGKTILNLEFAMTRDPAELAASHRAAADTLENELREGRDVAMLNLGDVSVYSTFAYMMELLRADGFESVMIPGVAGVCAGAAALGTGLTEMNEPLHILPAGGMAVDEALRLPGTKVLMKTGRAMPAVRAAIRRAGLADRTQLVQNCGLPDEKICRRLEEASDEISYFTTMIVKP